MTVSFFMIAYAVAKFIILLDSNHKIMATAKVLPLTFLVEHIESPPLFSYNVEGKIHVSITKHIHGEQPPFRCLSNRYV